MSSKRVRKSTKCGKRVAICYHFFADYRRPIFSELQQSTKTEYLFFADEANKMMPGVPTIDRSFFRNFVQCPCLVLPFGIMFQRGLISMALRRDLDAVIYLGDWKFLSTWLSAFVAKRTGKTVLYWTHGWKQRDRGVAGFFRRKFYQMADGLLLYGSQAKRIGIEFGFAPERLHVVNNSLNYERHLELLTQITTQAISNRRATLFGDDQSPIILCSSRLDRSKQLELLIHAADQLNSEDCRVNILLIGDGNAKHALEQLAIERSVTAVFLGACYDEEEIALCTSLSDVTVCPGPVGLTVIQSMTFGTPVITCDDFDRQKPEFEAIMPGETGDFFRAGCAKSLAATIKRFLAKSNVERESMRHKCRQVIRNSYNPAFQAPVIEAAVRLEPAAD